MDANIRFILGKTPLAEAVWLLFDNVLPDSFLGDFYDAHRGFCYEREFSFANIVHLVLVENHEAKDVQCDGRPLDVDDSRLPTASRPRRADAATLATIASNIL